MFNAKCVLSAECSHTPCPSRRHHVSATGRPSFPPLLSCSGCGRLRFSYPRGLHVSSPRPRMPIYRNCVCPAPTIPDSLRNRLPVLLPRYRFKVSQYVTIYYHHCGGQSRVFIASRVSGFPSLPPAFPLTRSSSLALCTHPCRI